jgi:hypothetical protein
MSTRSIIWTIVVVVIIVVLGWLLFSYGGTHLPGTSSDTATSTVATSTATGGTSAGTQATTLHSVMTQGGNYTCTIETITNGSDTTGTIYGANGDTRLDLTVAQSGGTTVTHIIRSGGTSYTWVDGQTVGVKAAITPTSPTVEEPGQGGFIAVNDNTNISSMCHPWIPDASQFVPPAGITFEAQ